MQLPSLFEWLLQSFLLGSVGSAVEHEPRSKKTALDRGGEADCLASTSHQGATIMHLYVMGTTTLLHRSQWAVSPGNSTTMMVLVLWLIKLTFIDWILDDPTMKRDTFVQPTQIFGRTSKQNVSC